MHLLAPEILDAQQHPLDEVTQQWLAFEDMVEHQGVVLRHCHLDTRWMVEAVRHHGLIVDGLPALDVILPGHALLVEPLADHEQAVLIDEILIDEGVDKHRVAVVLADVEDVVPALAGGAVKVATLDAVVGLEVFQPGAALVRLLLQVLQQTHPQGIGVESHPGHGGDLGVDDGVIHLMALDAVILEKEGVVPVGGPALVEDLGADLRLEVERGRADYLQHHQHPAIFFPLEKGGVFHEKLEQIGAADTPRFLQAAGVE